MNAVSRVVRAGANRGTVLRSGREPESMVKPVIGAAVGLLRYTPRSTTVWVSRARRMRSAVEVRHGSAEEGVATVFACLGLVALIGATLLIGQMGVVVVARHQAQAAADLASLAAAGALAQGLEAACVEAELVARRMGSRLEGCAAAEWDVTVAVQRNVPIGLFGDRIVSAVARAGPVEE